MTPSIRAPALIMSLRMGGEAANSQLSDIPFNCSLIEGIFHLLHYRLEVSVIYSALIIRQKITFNTAHVTGGTMKHKLNLKLICQQLMNTHTAQIDWCVAAVARYKKQVDTKFLHKKIRIAHIFHS